MRMGRALLRAASMVAALAPFAVGLAERAAAHSVSVGFKSTAAGIVTVYYGSYHSSSSLSGPEGTVTLTRQGGGYSATQSNSATYTSKPAGLTTGVNYFITGGFAESSILIWQSATFTGVPSGTYSIQLTGSFTAVWQPFNASISSPSTSFTIDASPPVISGIPANITVFTLAESATAVATWAAPTASDDVGIASFTSTHAPGASFPLGTTTVTYTATDTSGNVTQASFTVTVVKPVVAPSGQVVLRVVTTQGDGTFRFSSTTPALNVAVASAAGSGQSAPLEVAPGTHTVLAELPEGFGLTAVACSSQGSSGDASARTATIAVPSTELVTCTFSAANSLRRTTEVIRRFIGRRNDLLLSYGPDANRQVDRLLEAGDAASDSPASGLAGPLPGAAPPRQGRDLTDWRRSEEPAAIGAGGGGDVSRLRSPEGRTSFAERLPGLGPASSLAEDGGSGDGGRASFAISLSQYMRRAAEAEQRRASELLPADAMRLGAGPGLAKARTYSPLDVWMQGYYVGFDSDRHAGSSDGHFGIVHLGADYVLGPRLLVGASVQLDTMHHRSATQAFDIKGDGWMVGTFTTLRLSEHIFAQGRAALGGSRNEVRPFDTYADSFSTRRWLAATSLVGRWQLGEWQLRPGATVAYIEDSSEGYLDSLGVAIPGIKVSLGQLKAGPEVFYRLQAPDGTVLEPRIGAELIWNFAGSGGIVDLGDTLSGPDGARGRVSLGLRTHLTSGIGVDVSGSYDGIGSDDYRALAGKVMVRIPLH